MIKSRNHRSLLLLWTKETPCSCLKVMRWQGPWSDWWPTMDTFLSVTQVHLYLSPPLPPRSALCIWWWHACWIYFQCCPLPCLAFTLDTMLRAKHSLTHAFAVQCLTQPDGRQALRAVFGSWPSDALHMTSGVAGRKMGQFLLGSWRYPSSSPFPAGKGADLFLFVGLLRGFQLGF